MLLVDFCRSLEVCLKEIGLNSTCMMISFLPICGSFGFFACFHLTRFTNCFLLGYRWFVRALLFRFVEGKVFMFFDNRYSFFFQMDRNSRPIRSCFFSRFFWFFGVFFDLAKVSCRWYYAWIGAKCFPARFFSWFMNFHFACVPTRFVRRVIAGILRNGVRVFTCVVIFTRGARWFFQGVNQVYVIWACPFCAKGVNSSFSRFKWFLAFVWVCTMMDRFLNCGLRLFCSFKCG